MKKNKGYHTRDFSQRIGAVREVGMGSVDIKPGRDGVWIFTCTERSSEPGGEGNETVFVPRHALPELLAKLCPHVKNDASPLADARELLEPLLNLAYHTLNQDPAMEIFRDESVRLTIGDVRRLALRIRQVERDGIL
jgi:hypothetical protein